MNDKTAKLINKACAKEGRRKAKRKWISIPWNERYKHRIYLKEKVK